MVHSLHNVAYVVSAVDVRFAGGNSRRQQQRWSPRFRRFLFKCLAHVLQRWMHWRTVSQIWYVFILPRTLRPMTSVSVNGDFESPKFRRCNSWDWGSLSLGHFVWFLESPPCRFLNLRKQDWDLAFLDLFSNGPFLTVFFQERETVRQNNLLLNRVSSGNHHLRVSGDVCPS